MSEHIVTPWKMGLGWVPEMEAPAQEEWMKAGMPHQYYNSIYSADVRPLPKAFTLVSLIVWWFNQGPVGSCFANAAAQLLQIALAAAISAGEFFKEDQLSRAYIWYWARYFDKLLNQYDRQGQLKEGGSITNTMRALHEKGACVESLWPYKPDGRILDRKPADEALKAGIINHVTDVMKLDLDNIAARCRCIYNGQPVLIGQPWPAGWDNIPNMVDEMGRRIPVTVNSNGIITDMSVIVGGHALVDIGWAAPGIMHKEHCWHRVNSHELFYGILPPEIRNLIEGYTWAGKIHKPSPVEKCYSFWVPHSYDVELQRNSRMSGGFETYAPSGVAGAKIRQVSLPWERMMG